MNFERSDRYDERQKAALLYTSALVWAPESVDEELWARLRRHFSEPELVELGYFVAITYGQQRWIKTLGIGHEEVMAGTSGGLARASERDEVVAGTKGGLARSEETV